MAMKITGHPLPPTALESGRRPQAGPTSRNQGPSGHPPRGEAVSLTSGAAHLQALVRQVAELPVVDMERVAEVRARLEEGSFRIDPQRVAAKLLAFEQGRARL